MSSHGMCNGCGKGFGLFTKEDTCHNCGLNFCSKCVTNKVAVPKLNGEVRRVCVRCCGIIKGTLKDNNAEKRDHSPPANFLKNLEAAKQKSSQHGGPRRESLKKRGLTSDPVVKSHLKPEYRNLNKADMEIAERLEKLKQDHRELELGPKPLPPVIDVEQRLARLKGSVEPETDNPKMGQQASNMPQTKPMSQTEETAHLLNQVKEEVNIDRDVSGDTGEATTDVKGQAEPKIEENDDLDEIQSLIAKAAAELEIDAHKALVDLKKDKEIMAKLHELKSRKSLDVANEDRTRSATEKKTGSEESSEEEDEDEQVKTILQQALEERILDEQVEASGGFEPALRKQKSLQSPEADGMDPDELPWCCICNEDATLRCMDCDLDLYCMRCYRDGHKQLYEDEHQYIPYKKPVGNKSTTA